MPKLNIVPSFWDELEPLNKIIQCHNENTTKVINVDDILGACNEFFADMINIENLPSENFRSNYVAKLKQVYSLFIYICLLLSTNIII